MITKVTTFPLSAIPSGWTVRRVAGVWKATSTKYACSITELGSLQDLLVRVKAFVAEATELARKETNS